MMSVFVMLSFMLCGPLRLRFLFLLCVFLVLDVLTVADDLFRLANDVFSAAKHRCHEAILQILSC